MAGPKRGSYRLGIESVKACGDMAEEFRETPDQGGKVTKGAEPVEASHWRMPWCAVHEEEGRVETRVALTGEAHCGHGQALACDLALEDGLFGCECVIGHDPKHEGVRRRWYVRKMQDVQGGPEAAAERLGRSVELGVLEAGLGAEEL